MFEAEELAQETFVRACAGSLRFRGDSTVKTWLFGIARNVWLETQRKRGRPDIPADVSPGTPDIEASVDLERAFVALGQSDREILTIVDILGFTPAEAAGLNGMTPEATRVRLHRARKRLREACGNE